MRVLALPMILVLFVGCGSTAKIIRELAKDKASVCFTLTSIYGKTSIVRVGDDAAALRCGDGTAVVTPRGQ